MDELPPQPWDLVRSWVEDAVRHEAEHGDLKEPLMITVATVDGAGLPDVRAVLMRFLDPRGPGFLSSTSSAKADHLAVNPGMAGTLVWMPLFRAIRFRGLAERIADDEVNAYWTERPWGSQISAWSSRQSHSLTSRAELTAAFDRYAARWPQDGSAGPVPPPDDWAGWRIHCSAVELWAGRESRLHDRVRYERVGDGLLDDPDAWRVVRLQP